MRWCTLNNSDSEKNHSTVDAFSVLVAETLSALNENFYFLSVFIDLRKAFDSVSHLIILSKLERLGIRGMSLDWFRSYLMNRSQMVSYRNHLSDSKPVLAGMPQGSLLGVLLFQVHINDMVTSLKHTSAILYADDTTLYAYSRNLRALKV